MKYDLSHLTQTTTRVRGPIQDDEAILLYGLVRTMGLKYIVEVGGLNGYSAQNFVKAISGEGKVITIDPEFNNRFSIPLNDNFSFIKKPVENVDINELAVPRIDLLFFDCHRLNLQMDFYHKCSTNKLITDNTIICLHDTDIKPLGHDKSKDIDTVSNNYQTRGNTGTYPIHTAKAERIMSNKFMDMGYVPLHAHANYQDCPKYIENCRHGLTILSKPYILLVK